jgi:hypothetical protein
MYFGTEYTSVIHEQDDWLLLYSEDETGRDTAKEQAVNKPMADRYKRQIIKNTLKGRSETYRLLFRRIEMEDCKKTKNSFFRNLAYTCTLQMHAAVSF